MSVLARMLLGLLAVAGWLVLAAALILWVGEESGLLSRLVRGAVARELGALGDDLRLDGVRFRWFDRAIEIDHAWLGPEGEMAVLKGVRVELAPAREAGSLLRRIDIRSGRVRFSPALANGLMRYSERVAGQLPEAQGPAALPTLQIEDLDLEVVTQGAGVLPIGRLDLLARANARGAPEIFGRLVPTLTTRVGEPGEIFLAGSIDRDRTLTLRANATRLPLGVDGLPSIEDLDFLRAFEPHGLVELEVAATLPLDSGAPRATVRLAVQRGGARFAGGRHELDAVNLDVEARWTPENIESWRDPATWHALSRASGTWNGTPFDATALLGDEAGPDSLLEVWTHMPSLRIERALLTSLDAGVFAGRLWDGLDPRGATEAWVAARLPRASSGDPSAALSAFALARPDGQLAVTYHGTSRDDQGRYSEGFPMPLEKVTGEIAFAWGRERIHPWTVALLDLTGSTGASAIHAHGIVESVPRDTDQRLPTAHLAELDLDLASDRIAVDDRLRTVLEGLSGPVPPADTWKPFRPDEGEIGVKLRLFREAAMSWLSTDLELALRGVSLAWEDLPIPLVRANGMLRFRSDGVANRVLSIALDGNLRTAQRARFALRAHHGARGRVEGQPDDLMLIDLAVDRLALTGDDRKILVERVPGLGAALDELSPRGFAQLSYGRVLWDPAQPLDVHAEVTPLEPAQIVPKRFPMTATKVRGRALYSGREGATTSEADVRLAPLVAELGEGVQIAVTAQLPGGSLSVLAAGLEPSNKALLGAVGNLLGALDSSALGFAGRLDVSGEIPLAPEAENGSPVGPGRWRFFLRGSQLSTQTGFQLEDLRGELEFAGDVLSGDRLEARLASTPVELDDVRFAAHDDGWRLETGFAARGLPVDAAHLGRFFDAETLDALLGPFAWKGSFDFSDGQLSLTIPPQGTGRLELSGAVEPHAMSMRLGLPLEVDAADVRLDRLVLENGQVRALATVENFQGQLAGRALRDGRMVLTYVEPALSIESLSGVLEGGTLQALGAGAERVGTPFSIALEKPYPFQLALDLRDVQVEGLLRGLFPSGIATQGEVDGELRLAGDLEHLLGITGTGLMRVRQSRLWSVPVFRALFGQLGLDDTATFDSMYANLRIADGVLKMDDILLRSPLLQLVGAGELDFDGRLWHELEVRYALVDQLGPLTRMIYWIQNELLSVSIRGDMGRPVVVIQNPLRRLFGAPADYRALPAPGYAALPPRF